MDFIKQSDSHLIQSIMATFTSQIAILFLLLLSASTFHISISSNHTMVRCNEKDREILLVFKKGIIDPFDRLSTWSTEKDCCAWEGVHCDNITDRVTELDLSVSLRDWLIEYLYKPLEGEINFAFLELEFLSYLDLSLNSFDVISIPPIRHNITHASNLYHLDLCSSDHDDLHMDDLRWLSQLSSLRYLKLNGIDLHKETNWLQEVAIHPSLSDLHLKRCNLRNIMVNPFLKYVNFTSLVTLDLSYNNFNSELPKGLFNHTSDISYLDLSMNNIHGEIPSSLLSLPNLEYLYLSDNQLKGSIPELIGQKEYLRYLDISDNMLNGSFPSILGNLSSLVSLYIGSNYFSGEISKTTFSKLSNLDVLEMSDSTFAFQFDPDWVPPFQLSELYLANTNQDPNFPSWIYTQKSLEVLDLSSSGISLANGNKFFSFLEAISGDLFLSNNSMSGDISNLTLKAFFIELDHNNFVGRLPHISPLATRVDLSYNSFLGSIPRSWQNLKHLYYINLWSNRLSGEVLVHLSDLKRLQVMNLGKNEFSGTIPINMPQHLEVIILRGNKFEGNIPPQLFNQVSLFHLDLAHNKLSGSIPQCVYNMTQMVTSKKEKWIPVSIDLYMKGQDYEYNVNPNRSTIDLSANNFSGEVPSELFRLIQVQTLNLSYNNFSGIIPNQIGGMKNLESLDLSNNKFSGRIPQSMSLLNFLGYLNLSSNNFTGQIPIGTQLQSFNASSYAGNPELCGDPLKKCFTEEENPKNEEPSTRNEDGDPLRESLYLGMGVGFAVGFWGICGSLFLIRKWRHTFFRFFDRLTDWLYIAFMVKLNSFGKTGPPAS